MNGHHKQLLPSSLTLPRKLGKPELLWPTWSVCASSSWSSTESYSGQDPGWHPLIPRPTCQAGEEGQKMPKEKPVRLEEVGER